MVVSQLPPPALHALDSISSMQKFSSNMAELLLTLTIGFATDISDDAGLQSYVTKKLNHIKSQSFPMQI